MATAGRDGRREPRRVLPGPPHCPRRAARSLAAGWSRWVRTAIWLPGLAVALGAAAATAHGLFEVAVAARVPTGIAWLYPLMTDGLALVAYTATARLTGSARRYAWTVVVLAAGLSGLAQASYLAGGATLARVPARCGSASVPGPRSPPRVVAHLLYLLAANPTAPAARQRGRRGPGRPVDGAAAPPRRTQTVTSSTGSRLRPPAPTVPYNAVFNPACTPRPPYNPTRTSPSGTSRLTPCRASPSRRRTRSRTTRLNTPPRPLNSR